MRYVGFPLALGLTVLAASLHAAGARVPAAPSGPETFTATATVKGPNATATASVRVQIDRYTEDRDRKAMREALTYGGFIKFYPALKASPAVGQVTVGTDLKFTIRWASQESTASGGRVITIVTDQPIYFVGGSREGAKKKAGYDVAILQLDLDAAGAGTGRIAAAARIKPKPPEGIQLDDYADEPIPLSAVKKQ